MITGKCNACGKCCRTLIIKINKPTEESKKLLEWRGVNIVDLDENISAIILDSFKCKFLSRNNTCMIYGNRPDRCKKYPEEIDILLPKCSYKRI